GRARAVRLDEHLGIGLFHSAVPSLARLKIDDGLEEMAAAEVGPQNLGDVDLGVGDLPQQEVRHAQLATGANQQVGIVDVRGVKVIGEKLLVDHRIAHLALAKQGHDAIAGVDDLCASAVIERDLEQ